MLVSSWRGFLPSPENQYDCQFRKFLAIHNIPFPLRQGKESKFDLLDVGGGCGSCPLRTPPLYYWPGFTPPPALIGRARQFSHPTRLPLAETRVTGPTIVILLGGSVNSHHLSRRIFKVSKYHSDVKDVLWRCECRAEGLMRC